MSPVRIIETSYVNVPATATPPPAPFKLTSMSQCCSTSYSSRTMKCRPSMPFTSLQSSLAATLGSFAPLAGKLVHLKDTEDVTISRLRPPVDRGYIGVCLTRCLVMLPTRELRGTRALVAAASAVQDEIRRMNGDPTNQQNHLAPMMMASWDRVMNVSGSSAFRAYEIADFGWGKARRAENIRMNDDGQVALMRERDGLGVQVSVSLLQRAQMDEFKSMFLELFSGLMS